MSLLMYPQRPQLGEVAEWLNAPVLKTDKPSRASRVRIPPSPPNQLLTVGNTLLVL